MSREQLLLSQCLLRNNELAQRDGEQAKVVVKPKAKGEERNAGKIIKRVGTLVKAQTNSGNSEKCRI